MVSNKKRKKAKLPFPAFNQRCQELKNELDMQAKKIDRLQQGIETISKSYDNQIALLSNFASHDLKNYIHSIDGIISTRNSEEITDENLESIRLNLSYMRETLNNFAKLVKYDDGCSLSELIEAVKILNRATFAQEKIEFFYDELEQYIHFKIPFVSMLQLINNLIINAIKAVENTPNKKIYLQTTLDENTLTLSIFDNGVKIPVDIQSKIFDYGFSASGGSGIGLFHARYLCQMYDGSIDYHEIDDMKGFMITLPILKDNS